MDGSIDHKRGLYPDGSGMLNFAAFSIHTFELDHWKFLAGVRFNGYQINVSDEVLGEVRLTPSAFVWNAAAQRKLSHQANVFVSYHSGFRSPNIDDLGTLGIVDFRYEVPNYELRPERSHNIQLGFKFQNDKLRAETYLFRNELRNLVARVKTPDSIQGYAVYQKENIEQWPCHPCQQLNARHQKAAKKRRPTALYHWRPFFWNHLVDKRNQSEAKVNHRCRRNECCEPE